MEKTPVYLIMVGESKVDTSENHNKYYNLLPNGDDTFTAEYGRVGAGKQVKIYPMSKWDSTIKSKLKKGYVDITDLKSDIIEDSKVATEEENKNKTQDKFSLIKNTSVRDIIKRLFNFANKTVQASYKVTSEQVTQAMIDKAQEIIDELSNNYKNYSTEEFNNKLKELFITIPRKMKTVKSYLLSKDGTDENKEKIIQREQDTLDALAGTVYIPKALKEKLDNKNNSINNGENNPDEANQNQLNMLQEMGIEMEDCDENDIKKIKKAMGNMYDKFYKAWRVKNLETEEAYQKFTKENDIGNVKLLCHGSRNQNWFNILKQGLLIRPSGAIITGAMFGYGCYYGNPDKYNGGVQKSIGYTSLNGYWTRDSQNCGFIAFFDVALGESLDVYSFDSKYYNFDLKKLQAEKPNAWSLWAHGNTNMLRNDEIIVYTTKQMTIRYLVEIR